MTFLQKILPTEGLYCVAIARKKGFSHLFFKTIEEAQENLTKLDGQGHTVFMAQATFKTAESRKQTNAAFLRNFFFDIDCGDGKDYPGQKEAVTALKQFVEDTSLPFPSVVSSGNGLYAQWAIEEDIEASSWKTIARILKATAQEFGFRTDPMRTADSASVLRPPGATHRKDQSNLKTVQLLKDQPAIKFRDFVTVLSKAAKKKKINIEPTNPPKKQDINAEFSTGLDDLPSSSILKVAEGCAQIRSFRDSKGDVSEPIWYSSLGVMVFCEDGEGLVQEWSSGHPGYTEGSTAEKAQQYKDSGVGPTTCEHFGSLNPDGCVGCPHINKIKSPITLGWAVPEALEEATEDELPDTPRNFRRTEKGLFYEEEGRWIRFYDQDLRIERIAYDESLGYQIAVIKHSLPHDGELEFPIRSSLVHDPKSLLTILSDNNVHILGVKEKKLMVSYMESYIVTLQRKRKMTFLLNQMGWKVQNEKSVFVLGKQIFHADGTVDKASLAKHVPTAAHGFRSCGNPDKWVEATALLDKPDMEGHAFALLCGFAAPLMKFTGFDGAMIALDGDTGSGKTMMLRWIQSIYGYHNDLMMLRDDTRNALISRLGTYGNLPLTIDEVTNIDGQELSDLVYRITQGRDKARLTKNAEEKKALNRWNTLAVVSTNSSLIDKLSGVKHDASAEVNRLFEYRIKENPRFKGDITSNLWFLLNTNYGHIGEKYITYLVQNEGKIVDGMRAVQAKIDKLAKVKGEERYWSAIAATAIYGGLVAKKLGLIKFDVTAVMTWAVDQIKDMRIVRDDLADNSISILGQFLDEYANNRLIVRDSTDGHRVCNVVAEPRGALVIRYEADNHRVYFPRTLFKTWVGKKYGSYNKIKKDLAECKILRSHNRPKTLGAGTTFTSAQQPCWEIDMLNHHMGAYGMQTVKQVKEAVTDKIYEGRV